MLRTTHFRPPSDAIPYSSWRQRPAARGFSGIELTIIIIILGVIFVMALRGAAAIPIFRSYVLAHQVQNMQAAVEQYLTDYRALPGDDTAAPDRWKLQPSLYKEGTTIVSYAGDGRIQGQLDDSANTLGEQYLAWQHLRAGGYISGDPSLVGQAARPENRFGGAFGFAEDEFGLDQVLCLTKIPGKDAELLDRKLDDGNPATGKVRASSKWDPLVAHNHFAEPDKTAYDPQKTYIICTSYLP